MTEIILKQLLDEASDYFTGRSLAAIRKHIKNGDYDSARYLIDTTIEDEESQVYDDDNKAAESAKRVNDLYMYRDAITSYEDKSSSFDDLDEYTSVDELEDWE